MCHVYRQPSDDLSVLDLTKLAGLIQYAKEVWSFNSSSRVRDSSNSTSGLKALRNYSNYIYQLHGMLPMYRGALVRRWSPYWSQMSSTSSGDSRCPGGRYVQNELLVALIE